jgi:hypothetical protein
LNVSRAKKLFAGDLHSGRGEADVVALRDFWHEKVRTYNRVRIIVWTLIERHRDVKDS